ncbi:1 3-beta-glucanosyltransferase gel4 [Massospora cicadina]|nr:1 3-beta-glucanosyltransferase gel4 [Massospora cicadina]
MNVLGLNRIVFEGSKLFDEVTGDQFFVKGIAYQPGGQSNSDVLADGKGCERDVKYLKELGVNTVRVYGALPKLNHDRCMATFERAKIYLMLDLPTPRLSIDRGAPRYDIDLLNHYKANVDAFAKYNNVLAFVAGNEVTNDLKTTQASAHVKAALRDTKAYIANRGYRIPVGYVDNDDPNLRSNIQSYFNCGTDAERADFYGINIYSWCGDSDFVQSGYKSRTEELRNYSTPVMLTEYGCNVASTRPFTEIQSLYGKDMEDVFSGGFVYEYSYEANRYGLVKIQGDDVVKLPDFETVKAQLAKVHPKKIKRSQYRPKLTHRQCPKVTDRWRAGPKLPPPPSQEACQCAYDSLSCRVNEAGTQPENGQKVGEQLGYICRYGVCGDVESDVSTGTFGPFSTCSTKVSNSIIFNAAAKGGTPCDFKGMAERATPNKDLHQCRSLTQPSYPTLEYSAYQTQAYPTNPCAPKVYNDLN